MTFPIVPKTSSTKEPPWLLSSNGVLGHVGGVLDVRNGRGYLNTPTALRTPMSTTAPSTAMM